LACLGSGVPENAQPTFDDVQRARDRIAPFVRRTPVLTSEELDARTGCRLFFKCENLQHTGSFKARGATNAVFSLGDAEATRGVAAHSSGNHAAAVARAARLRGIPCFIVMPHNVRQNKLANVRRFGAEITFCEDSAEARDAATAEAIARTGATLVHPYDSARTVAGQGTVALELLEQVPDLDAVLVPVGGGGLTAGVLTVVKSLRPEVLVVAAEPAVDRDAYQSWRSGTPAPAGGVPTLADGLRAPLGTLNTAIIHRSLDDMVHASEASIAAATRLLVSATRTVVEPSGAIGVAALLESGPGDLAGERVGVVLSGGNIEIDDLQRLGCQPAGPGFL
jgi:threonine dehydratase